MNNPPPTDKREYTYAVPMSPLPYVRLSDEQLNEFIAIYRREYKEDITRAQALEMATNLLSLYQLFSRQLPSEHSASQNSKQHDDENHRNDHPGIGFRT